MSARSPKTIFLVGVVLVATAFVAIWGLRNKSVRPISATGGKDFESGNVLEVPLYSSGTRAGQTMKLAGLVRSCEM